MEHILIVEDEPVIRKALRKLLERHDYHVSEAGSVQEATKQLKPGNFNLIISDLRLPGAPGTELVKAAKNIPVLIMTSYASLKSAVDSMKLGAVDYIAKPFDHQDMIQSVSKILRDQKSKPKKTDTPALETTSAQESIVGSCTAMQELFNRIKKVAPTNTTILIHGETGTGKELVASAIHQQSKRSDQPLICVNCAAIPETLIESELFGYEKGAFTGANSNRLGLIEAADGGTLFLDEIGELPLEAQARLLRVIQESEIRRIGSVHSKKVDVRLICATHRDLKNAAAKGKFREDLFFRINVMPMELPPLRERGKDILDIAETFLKARGEEMEKPNLQFSPAAIQAITTYSWPGNVRELENAVERAAILTDSDEIDNELLGLDLELISQTQVREKQKPVNIFRQNPEQEKDFVAGEELSLEDYFQRFVLEHQDSMSETELAQKLGVSRKCLWERRQRLGIPRKKSAKS